MQQTVSELMKEQRELFFIHDVRVDNTDRELQVKSCSEKSGSGFHLRTPGRIITSHVVLGIGGREHGGFRVTLTRNGRFLALVHSYGFLENVSISHRAFSPLETDAFLTAGAGKSVIWYDILSVVHVHLLILLASSAMVEDIRALQKFGLASLAFFYCDFREREKNDVHGLLSSLLVQLGDQSDICSATLSDFYAAHGRGTQHPSDGELLECLKGMLKRPGHATVHIIIDGLDECSTTTGMPSPRENVSALVKELVALHLPNLRICVTSRPEVDISYVLQSLNFRSVLLHKEKGQVKDISEYIKSVIDKDAKMQRWNATAKQLVIDLLTRKADGM
jgi:hypothetical protein